MRYFDQENNRLIYFEKQATPDFWDSQWQADSSIREDVLGAKSTYVTRIAQKYLKPEDGIILEGGCGNAQHVAALTSNGYRCIGIDFAQQPVSALRSAVLELDVRLGDVRHLDFGSLDSLHRNFEPYVDHVLWSETSQAGAFGGELGTDAIRTIIRVRKQGLLTRQSER